MFFVAVPAYALTQWQVDSIIGLLRAFNVEESVVIKVKGNLIADKTAPVFTTPPTVNTPVVGAYNHEPVISNPPQKLSEASPNTPEIKVEQKFIKKKPTIVGEIHSIKSVTKNTSGMKPFSVAIRNTSFTASSSNKTDEEWCHQPDFEYEVISEDFSQREITLNSSAFPTCGFAATGFTVSILNAPEKVGKFKVRITKIGAIVLKDTGEVHPVTNLPLESDWIEIK